jgi:hypothetical protein
MKIAIIGAGHVGGALAKSLAKAGHQIILGVRHPDSEEVKLLLEYHPSISVASVDGACQIAETVIVSALPQSIIDVLDMLGDLNGKVVIDTMNTVKAKPEPFENTFEALQSRTNSQDIVKCFNTTGFENLENPVYNGEGIDMFMAGSSKRAKEVAARLAKDIGFAECYDFGGDDKVALLESMAMIWINLAIMQKQGRNIALKIVKR